MTSNRLSAAAWLGHAEPPALGVAGATLARLGGLREARGRLTVGEIGKELPFVARRFFVISEVPSADIRGEHAHRDLHQFLVCLAGRVAVDVDDASARRTVVLDTRQVGLHIAPMVWGSQYEYSEDALLLVLASAEYDPAEYIRDYREFVAAVGARAR